MGFLIGQFDHINNTLICVVRNKGGVIARFETAQKAWEHLQDIADPESNLKVVPDDFPRHICYEDNQGMCHNGCGRVLNQESAEAYFSEDK